VSCAFLITPSLRAARQAGILENSVPEKRVYSRVVLRRCRDIRQETHREIHRHRIEGSYLEWEGSQMHALSTGIAWLYKEVYLLGSW
jgi:hypothetical protein